MSVRLKFLFALLLFALGPTLLVGALIFNSAEKTMVSNRVASLEAIAEIKLKSIQDFIERSLRDHFQIAQLNTLHENLAVLINFQSNPGAEQFRTATKTLDNELFPHQKVHGLSLIILTDVDGRVVYQSDPEHPQQHLGRQYNHISPQMLALAVEQGPLVRFYTAPEVEKDGILVAGAVKNDDRTVGLLFFEINLDLASNIFLDNTGLGQTGKTVLGIKVDDSHFTHLTPSLQNPHGKDRKVVPFRSQKNAVAMQKAVSGQNGSGFATNFKGTELIAVWRYIPELDLGMVAKVNTDEALASIAKMKESTFTILLVVVVCGVLGAQFLARSITQPILLLKAGIKQLARGELDTRIGLSGNDEITDVAKTFNEMTTCLAEVTASRDELNREINERRMVENLLRESETRLRDLFDNANDLIQSVGPDGSILFVNKSWQTTLGYDERDISTLNIFDVIHEDSLSHCQLEFEKMMNGGSGGNFEAAFKTKSGQKILLEGVVSIQMDNGIPIASRGIFRDITERKEIELRLEKERTFLQTIINGVNDPLMVIGLNYEVLLMNKACEDNVADRYTAIYPLYCYQASHQCANPCNGEDHPCPLRNVQKSGQPVTVTHQHFMKDGSRRIFELVASPYLDDNGELLGIIESSRDITDRLAMQQDIAERDSQLEFLAHHDPLTDLPNRLHFNKQLQRSMAQAKQADKQVALLFLDIDRFKNINDSLGHAAGDEILCEVAQRIRHCVRESDTVARLGGDEFLVIVENLYDMFIVATLAQKIQGALNQPITLGGNELTATASIGISSFPNDAVDVEGLLKCADVAMYRAKEQGRNNYQFYTSDMDARTHELLLLESDLRKALEQEQMILHYQPQVDIDSGRIIGTEALVRWQHPEKGLIPPADFIPLAEETGLIVPLGEWVIKAACEQSIRWQKEGFPEMVMAVNVSARQFRQTNFLESIEQILEKTGLAPRLLEMEITESTVMKNVASAIAIMNSLHTKGIKLAIDDFGTGYSSLSYLKRFPVSTLKIDRSFIKDITSSSNDSSIAESIIALAKTMNMTVLAEGIETKQQHQLLEKLGCKYGQGYLFSKPVSAEDLTTIMRTLYQGKPITEKFSHQAINFKVA